MMVKIRSKGFHLFLPIPLSLLGFAIRWIPEQAFTEMRLNTPEPYRCLITRENARMLSRECLDVLKENKGLEIVHVEEADGTLVSIKL